MHFLDGIDSFVVKTRNTKIVYEIYSKLTIKTAERRRWQPVLNFNTLTKDVYCFHYALYIYSLFRFHPFRWPKPSVFKSDLTKHNAT